MISKICGINFKGLTFEQALGQYTLVVGGMGIGKSARSQALALAILGYLPQDQKKKAGDIFETHSSGGDFTVGFAVSNNGSEHLLSRVYRKKNDNVIQDIVVNGKKLQQKEASRAIMKMGDPKILDLKSFLDLSDRKKIDYLFDLYPPDIDIISLETEIEKLSQGEKTINEDIRKVDHTIETLTNERSLLDVPAGTLPEIQVDMEAREKELAQTRENLKSLEIKEREDLARKESEKKVKVAEANTKTTKEILDKSEREIAGLKERLEKRDESPAPDKTKNTQALKPINFELVEGGAIPFPVGEIIVDLQAILAVLTDTGCETCAARLKIKSLLSKYNELAA